MKYYTLTLLVLPLFLTGCGTPQPRTGFRSSPISVPTRAQLPARDYTTMREMRAPAKIGLDPTGGLAKQLAETKQLLQDKRRGQTALIQMRAHRPKLTQAVADAENRRIRASESVQGSNAAYRQTVEAAKQMIAEAEQMVTESRQQAAAHDSSVAQAKQQLAKLDAELLRYQDALSSTKYREAENLRQAIRGFMDIPDEQPVVLPAVNAWETPQALPPVPSRPPRSTTLTVPQLNLPPEPSDPSAWRSFDVPSAPRATYYDGGPTVLLPASDGLPTSGTIRVPMDVFSHVEIDASNNVPAQRYPVDVRDPNDDLRLDALLRGQLP